MAKTMFTKAALERIEPPAKGRAYLTDARTPGLLFQVTAAGARSFYFYAKIQGRPERVFIGKFPDITIDQARDAVHRLRGEVATGHNPAEKRRQARAVFTLGELWEAYLERAKSHKRTWRQDQYQYDQHLDGWKHRKLSTIRKADVAGMHAKIGKDAPYAANRLLALLTTMFNVAKSDFGFEGDNPCRGVKRFKERKRDRFLQPEELKRFFAALSDEKTPDVWRDFFSLCLLTGARRANVQAARWEEIDLERGVWTVPDLKAKAGETLTIHLPARAVEIFKDRKAKVNSEWVFPSYGACGHICEPKMAWDDLCERAKLSDVRIHDLRRTLASWAAITGASLNVIGAALGHRDVATTAIYARLTATPVRDAVDKAATAILSAGGVLVPATVEQAPKPKRERKTQTGKRGASRAGAAA